MARKEMARCVLSEVAPGDATLADALGIRERAVRCLMDRMGLDTDGIFAPPRQRSVGAERYCPACEAEYLKDAEACADCGIPLAGFGDPDGPAAKNPLARNPFPGKMGIPSGA